MCPAAFPAHLAHSSYADGNLEESREFAQDVIVAVMAVALPLSMSQMVFHLSTKLKYGIKPSLLGRSPFASGFREPVESNVFSANCWLLDRGFFLVAGANGNAPLTRRWKETPHGSSPFFFRSGAVDADWQRLQAPI
jgi:hypothetical protein